MAPGWRKNGKRQTTNIPVRPHKICWLIRRLIFDRQQRRHAFLNNLNLLTQLAQAGILSLDDIILALDQLLKLCLPGMGSFSQRAWLGNQKAKSLRFVNPFTNSQRQVGYSLLGGIPKSHASGKVWGMSDVSASVFLVSREHHDRVF
jgi:hypothetical protein